MQEKSHLAFLNVLAAVPGQSKFPVTLIDIVHDSVGWTTFIKGGAANLISVASTKKDRFQHR